MMMGPNGQPMIVPQARPMFMDQFAMQNNLGRSNSVKSNCSTSSKKGKKKGKKATGKKKGTKKGTKKGDKISDDLESVQDTETEIEYIEDDNRSVMSKRSTKSNRSTKSGKKTKAKKQMAK